MKKFLFSLFLFCIALTGLQAQTECLPPGNLTASLHQPGWQHVLLNWDSPQDTSSRDLKWSTLTPHARIGFNEPSVLTGVIRFEPSDLTSVADRYLTAVSFVPYEVQSSPDP